MTLSRLNVKNIQKYYVEYCPKYRDNHSQPFKNNIITPHLPTYISKVANVLLHGLVTLYRPSSTELGYRGHKEAPQPM